MTSAIESNTSPLIGCVQLNSQQSIDDNLKAAQKAIADASHRGVRLIVLPENMMSMGRQHQLAQRFDELSATFADLAERYNMYILAGTLPCAYRPCGTIVPNNRLRQVSQMFDPSAHCIARYDKIHLFKAQVSDTQGSYDETQTFESGDTLRVAECQLIDNQSPVNVGMMVCFDLRFPALAQRLRSFGAQILTAPSAFTYQTGQAHWQLLLQARALDAQCMVVGAAQGGEHQYASGTSRHTWGHAAITLANGTIAAQHDSDTLTTTHSSSATSTIHGDNAQYVLITANFDSIVQTQWRHDLPIQRCHRLS